MRIENYGLSPDSIFFVEEDEGKSMMPDVHTHNINELYYLTSGSINYFIGQETYHVSAGDFVIIPAGVPHKTAMSLHRARILIHFGSSYIIEESIFKKLSKIRVYTLNPETVADIKTLINKIQFELDQSLPYSKTICAYALNEIFALLCRNQGENKNNRLKNRAIFAAEEFIKENYMRKLTLEDIANHVFLSKNYFSKLFNKQNGISVTEYITIIRIQKAAELLESGVSSITAVAEQTGFSDSNYFSAQFKKFKGQSPRKYYYDHCTDFPPTV